MIFQGDGEFWKIRITYLLGTTIREKDEFTYKGKDLSSITNTSVKYKIRETNSSTGIISGEEKIKDGVIKHFSDGNFAVPDKNQEFEAILNWNGKNEKIRVISLAE